MSPTIDTQAIAQRYTQAFQHFRELPGFNIGTVLKAEAGSILKAWAGKVKVATTAQIDRRARANLSRDMHLASADKNDARITINSGGRGGFVGEVWFKTRGGFDDATKAARKKAGLSANGSWQQAGVIKNNGKFKPAWIHFKSGDWAKIDRMATEYASKLTNRVELAKRSAGFARQSVIQIATELGINLFDVEGGRISDAGLAKGYAAVASNGMTYQNGRAVFAADEVKGFVRLINTLPYNQHRGTCTGGLAMDATLALVLAGRAGMIERSYKMGVFKSAQSVERQFPNVFKVTEQVSFPLAA